MRVAVVTYLDSPHQADLFDAITAAGQVHLDVVYLHRVNHVRRWTTRAISHEAICLDEDASFFGDARKRVLSADLAVINYYAERPAHELLGERASSGKPWCFWGERPGFRKPEYVSRVLRKWKLSRLHSSRAPIWGIGRVAVEAYKTEFGPDRLYTNLPYFTDLERFAGPAKAPADEKAERVFLFAGSLIARKGIDLLARAFVQLAAEFPNVRLRIIGEGELQNLLKRILDPIGGRAEFLGFKDWPDLPACYASADVFCVPSRYDGWGMVVPEGLASGLPVIASDRMGAAVEFIKHGWNGWLVEAGSEESILSALREAALAPTSRLAELQRNARESVRGHSLADGAARFYVAAREACETWQ